MGRQDTDEGDGKGGGLEREKKGAEGRGEEDRGKEEGGAVMYMCTRLSLGTAPASCCSPYLSLGHLS